MLRRLRPIDEKRPTRIHTQTTQISGLLDVVRDPRKHPTCTGYMIYVFIQFPIVECWSWFFGLIIGATEMCNNQVKSAMRMCEIYVVYRSER